MSEAPKDGRDRASRLRQEIDMIWFTSLGLLQPSTYD